MEKREATIYSVIARVHREHVEWQRHNFGDRPTWQALVGLVEELGELEEARTQAQAIDAVGDVTIFLISFAHHLGLNPAEVYQASIIGNRSERDPWGMCDVGEIRTKLARHYLKMEQGIRGSRDEHMVVLTVNIAKLFDVLADLSFEYGRDYGSVVLDVWADVSKRDWKVNAQDGQVGKRFPTSGA